MRAQLVENFRSGDNVRYTGSIEEQVRWGGNDNPVGILIVSVIGLNSKVAIIHFYNMSTLMLIWLTCITKI